MDHPWYYGAKAAEMLPGGIGSAATVGNYSYEVHKGHTTVGKAIVEASIDIGVGIVGGKALKGLGSGGKYLFQKVIARINGIAARKSATGVSRTIDANIKWGKGIHEQGMPWEDFLAKSLPADARLPRNFKTFDFYDRKTMTAISAKTLNTQTASKLANPEKIYHSLKKNIDAAAGFTEYRLLKEEVTSQMLSARHVEVAIPKGTTPLQWTQINRAIQYGQGKGINIKINEVR